VTAWPDLVTASLIGTERAGVPAAADPGLPVQPEGVPDDPAARLLDRAALLTVARRGGRPAGQAEPPPAAEPDPAPAVSPAAARRLARMLGGEHPDLLAEWLTAAVTHGRRAPAHLLPALLDRARRVSPSDPELRRLSAEAGGSRARWLAGLNPDWAFVTAYTGAGEVARELNTQGWEAAGPERVMFPLDCVRIENGARGTRLVVIPPARSDAATRRDGVHEVLARTPLRTWTGRFGRTAEQILAVPSGAWALVLFTGWSRAAMAQRDQEWMTALINWAFAGGPTGTLSGAETLRRLARRVDPARCAIQATAGRGAEIPPPIRDAIGVLRFRYDMLKELEL
jgi:hypothetical protein